MKKNIGCQHLIYTCLNMVRSCLLLWLIGLVCQVTGPKQVDRLGRVVRKTIRTKSKGIPNTIDMRIRNGQSEEGHNSEK